MKFTVALLLSVSALIGLEVVANLLIMPRLTLGPLKAALKRFSQKPSPEVTINEAIRAAARKHKVKPAFIKSIIKAESNFDQNARSPKGAMGLMQLMPETAREMHLDPASGAQNVYAGTQYLSWLLTRYRKFRDRVPRAIAAYNAGPGNVDKYRGIPPFAETRAYVKRVLANLQFFTHGTAPARMARAARRRSLDEMVLAD